MKNKEGFLNWIATGLLIISSICFFLIFFIAYINPTKATTIFINKLGEANLEILMITIIIGFVSWRIPKILETFKRNKETT